MGFSPEPVKKGLARVLSRGKLLLHLERVPRKSGKAGAASLGSVELEGMATVDDLKAAYTNLPASRQEWRLVAEPGQKRGKALRSGVLSEIGLKSGMAVQLKDLGPQVGYSTVFFWEEKDDTEAGNFGDPFGVGMYNDEMRNKEINN